MRSIVMKIVSFESMTDMQSYMAKATELASKAYRDSGSPKWDYGDKFVKLAHGITIVGEVRNPLDWYKDKDIDNNEELREEYNFEKESHEASVESGYMYTNCISEMCPSGELGTTHATEMTKITNEEYESAKRLING